MGNKKYRSMTGHDYLLVAAVLDLLVGHSKTSNLG